ncbi:MAG: cysteine hydrolase [Alphaproteobacteria bacterium]|nr:cysteine hydrolase [Alphaproteobacteria bacterium]
MHKKNLLTRIRKASAFFEEANLKKCDLRYVPDVAVLVVDAQKEFCDPKGDRGNESTDKTSDKIASIIPQFRKAAVPVYAIYTSRQPLPRGKIDFHKFQPAGHDKRAWKPFDSGFECTDLKAKLEKERRKLLLICGFNMSACVMDTALDARRNGFDVCLMLDLTANDNDNPYGKPQEDLNAMMAEGIQIITSEKALKALSGKKKKRGSPKPPAHS